MTTKNIEDLTLDEIREQMALYQRLYYKKRREIDPEFVVKKRERDRQLYHEKKKVKEEKGKLKTLITTENTMLKTLC